MQAQNRRAFIAGATALGATTILNAKDHASHEVPKLVHHVFFWLKRPRSEEDRNALLEGLRTLAGIPTVRGIHLGVPASTEKREVVENSYSVSELLYFDDVAGQDAYQVHPIHKAFVEKCSPLWEKVVVFDSISV